MKKLIAIFFVLSGIVVKAQFNPSIHVTINDAIGQSQQAPIEGRGMYWDAVNFKWRDFQSTAEVLSTLPTNANRFSHFPIWIHVGGTLSGGVWTGGISQAWFFKDGLANGNLVRWYTDSTGTAGALLAANNLSDLANITTAKTNLSLQNVDNTSDATKNAASVSLTNHNINGNSNTITNIGNSSLTNSQIGLSITSNAASNITVTTTPAALGSSLGVNIPDAGLSQRGALKASDFVNFSNKIDSVHVSNDSVYDCIAGVCTLRGVVSGGAGSGITNLNGLTATTQIFTPGTTGTDFNVLSSGSTHTFNFPDASASNRGLLTSADWTTFNGKQPQLNGTGFVKATGTSISYDNSTYLTNITGLVTGGTNVSIGGSGTSGSPYVISSSGGAGLATASGDASGTVSGTNLPLTFATVNGNVGSFGTATNVGSFTVNAKGLITAASNTSIQIPESQVTNLTTDLAGKQSTALTNTHILVGNVSNVATDVAMSGDVGIANTGATTIQANAVTTGKIINSAVTLGKMANGTAFSLIGYDASGVPIGYTAGTNITISGGTISATSGGGGITQLFAKAPIQILGTDTVKADTTTAGTGLATLYQESLKLVKPIFPNNLYVANSWASLTDFTVVGSPTFALSGSKLSLSGGNQQPSTVIGTNNAAFNTVIEITSYGASMIERNAIIDTFVINNVPSATTYGFGPIKYSNNATKSNCAVYFNASTATGSGTVSLLLGIANTTAAISPSALTFSNADQIAVSMQFIGTRVVGMARNITTNSAPVICSYNYDLSNSAAILMPNTGIYGIVQFGGAELINSISVTSSEPLGPNIIFLGDSKFQGYETYYDAGIARIFNRFHPGSISMSGQGDRTQDVLNHLHEVIAYAVANKTIVIVCIGRNDLSGGVSLATWQANLRSIYSQLNAAGITWYTLDAIYETTQNQATLVAFQDSCTLTQGKLIQVFAAGQALPLSVAPDGVHPWYAGAELVSDIIRNYFTVNNVSQFLNDKYPIRADVGYLDSLKLNGPLDINTSNSSGLYYIPAIKGKGFIYMGAGQALTSSYGLPNQQGLIYTTFNTDASTRIINTTGSNPGNNIINFYTSGGTTGNQVLNASITQGGAFTTGAATGVNTTATLNRGDIVISANSAFKSGTANDGLHENQIILDTAANGNTMFRNYGALGSYLFFQAKNTAGSQTQTMTLAPRGGLLLGGTTEDSLAILNMTSTTKGFYPTRMTLAQANALPSLGASIGLGLHSIITDSASKLGYWNGTKWIMYATTDQLGGGGAVSSVTATNTTLTISPTTGSVLAGLNLANANTWTGKQTQPAPILTGTTSAGANDSVATIDPASGQVHWRSGNFNLYFANGLTGAGGDSAYLGGALNQNTTINGGSGKNLSLGSGSDSLGTLTLIANSGIFLNSAIIQQIRSISNTSAPLLKNDVCVLLDGALTADRTITMPAPNLNFGRTITVAVRNASTNAFHFLISGSVSDASGSNTISQFENNTTYLLQSSSSNWIILAQWSNGVPLKYPHTIFTPTTGGTVALVNNQYNIINPAGALVALTVNLPSSPANNDVVYIKFTQTVSTVTYGNGTVVDGITAPTAGGLTVLIYDSASASWY